jgi:peptide/nickel transport system permease protein
MPHMQFNRAAIQGLSGLAVTVVLITAVAFAPWISPHAPGELIGDVWGSPSIHAWFGYDSLGRDMLSRLLYGGRFTLLIGFAGTLGAFAIGMTLGLLTAVGGKAIDILFARLFDTLIAVPPLIFALVLLSVLGTSMPVMIATIAVLSSTRVFRVSRSLGQGIAALDFFEAARLRRESAAWLIGREILPNIAAPLITEFGLRLCSNFLLVASLSFLGLGVQPPYADWGSMVRDNVGAIGFGGVAPLFPAGAIALLAIGINMMIDWRVSRQSDAAV